MARMRRGHVSAAGLALRELRGDQAVGDGPIEIMTRVQDFNTMNLQTPDGQVATVPAQSLVAFTAQGFRELTEEREVLVDFVKEGADRGVKYEVRTRPADVWEFRVQTPEGAFARMFLAGDDILLVRAFSKVL